MLQYIRILDDEEFFGKYEIDPITNCWIWKAGLDNWGYGYIKGHGGAHRVSFQIYKGSIPKGLLVCHTCDTPACVNPDHLWLGTVKENALDRSRKGRGNAARGEDHGLRKHPERAARGDKNGSRLHPEKLSRGENHWIKKFPEKKAWGDRNGARTHPERYRGENHWMKRFPEKIKRGTDHHSSKLNFELADTIREIYKRGGITYSKLAKQFGLSQSAISSVLNNYRWKK